MPGDGEPESAGFRRAARKHLAVKRRGELVGRFLPHTFKGPRSAAAARRFSISIRQRRDESQQRANLDLLARLTLPICGGTWQSELAARMEASELAFRMQTEVPQLVDLESEDAKNQELYGPGPAGTDSFAAAVCWRESSWPAAFASCRFMQRMVFRTITCSGRTRPAFARSISPSRPCLPISTARPAR